MENQPVVKTLIDQFYKIFCGEWCFILKKFNGKSAFRCLKNRLSIRHYFSTPFSFL
jgi:hypothetical protein